MSSTFVGVLASSLINSTPSARVCPSRSVGTALRAPWMIVHAFLLARTSARRSSAHKDDKTRTPASSAPKPPSSPTPRHTPTPSSSSQTTADAVHRTSTHAIDARGPQNSVPTPPSRPPERRGLSGRRRERRSGGDGRVKGRWRVWRGERGRDPFEVRGGGSLSLPSELKVPRVLPVQTGVSDLVSVKGRWEGGGR